MKPTPGFKNYDSGGEHRAFLGSLEFDPAFDEINRVGIFHHQVLPILGIRSGGEQAINSGASL